MKNVKINSKVEMIAANGKKTFGTLYDIRDDIIMVSVFPGDKTFTLFYPGDKLELVIYDTESLFIFGVEVLDRESGDLLIYKFTRISEIKKHQRRDHVRIEYSSMIHYSLDQELINSSLSRIENIVVLENNLEGFKKGFIEDISGGGLRLRTNEKLEAGLTLRTDEKLEPGLILVLKVGIENEDIVVKGELCHREEKEINGEKFYSYGVEFVDVDETTRDKIVEFVFLLMRKNKLV